MDVVWKYWFGWMRNLGLYFLDLISYILSQFYASFNINEEGMPREKYFLAKTSADFSLIKMSFLEVLSSSKRPKFKAGFPI